MITFERIAALPVPTQTRLGFDSRHVDRADRSGRDLPVAIGAQRRRSPRSSTRRRRRRRNRTCRAAAHARDRRDAPAARRADAAPAQVLEARDSGLGVIGAGRRQESSGLETRTAPPAAPRIMSSAASASASEDSCLIRTPPSGNSQLHGAIRDSGFGIGIRDRDSGLGIGIEIGDVGFGIPQASAR